MMRILIQIPLVLLLTLSGTASWGGGTGLTGSVMYRGEAVSGVYIEAFTKNPESGVPPASSTNSTEDGQYMINLPRGKYYITARKRPGVGTSGGMLYGTTGDLPIAVGKTVVPVPAISLSDSGSVGGGLDSGVEVTGKVFSESRPLTGAFVYLYPEDHKRGPGYLARVRSGEGGRFKLRSPPGLYNITSRFSPQSEGLGSVKSGDLVGGSGNNPIRVGEQPMDVGVIEVHIADPTLLVTDGWAAGESGLAAIGVVRDEEGNPVSGIYAFLYRDFRMVGKPDAISAPTGEDGRFLVTAPGPGSYYLGARSSYGGPMEPGELVGVYEKSGSRAVTLTAGKDPIHYEIVVREAW